ncbi:MAG TPA: hypothetical protein VJA86_01960 [Candidatus Nanoarchaeia archaeon]|nr:hypothetical protein [Candidatus Nanoarchaeia archaeon]
MRENKGRKSILIAVFVMILITAILAPIIINYYSKEKALYFDALLIDIIAILFSLFLIYDGFRDIDKKFISCLTKIAAGTAIFIIHLLEIVFIRVLR